MLYTDMKETAVFKEMKQMLKGLDMSQLKQVYYYLFVYDSRLPDLFSLIPQGKLKKYLYMSFCEKCTMRELEEAIKALNYK